MASSTKKKKLGSRAKSSTHGRPMNFSKPASSRSSKVTRQTIRQHHQLQKQYAAAVVKGDDTAAEGLAGQIEEKGGLRAYQQASLKGQSNERGGDSSKVLIEWLRPISEQTKHGSQDGQPKARMLEVGALHTSNACSRSGVFEVTRIDLSSQHKEILKQDFMERPLPSSEGEKFDVISLSLVLNYVPDATQRGEMLRRSTQFLQKRRPDAEQARSFPALFLVLPAPCILNSRYLDEERLSGIMTSLGYALLERKISPKLAYSLWRFDSQTHKKSTFKKVEVRPGHPRNNFAIILK